MALPLNNEDEDKDQASKEGQPQQLGTESAVIQGQAQQGGTPEQGSGQYTNLQSYLAANKDSGMGEKLASNVSDTISNAGEANRSAQTGFEGLVNAGSVVPSERVFQDVQDNPSNLGQDEISEFKKIRDARYQGPENFAGDAEDYSKAYTANRSAGEETEASQTEPGRFGLLQKYYNRPDYTPGQQKLDQLLVQNDPASRAAFENVSNQNAQQQERYKNLQDTLNQYATTNKEATQAGRTEARGLIGIDDAGNATGQGLLGTTKAGIQSRTQSQINQRNSDYQALQNALHGGGTQKLTEAQQKSLGIDINAPTWQMDDPARFLTNNADWNTESLATPEERAKYQALADLAGTGGEFLSGQNAGSQVGHSGYNFDQGKFSEAQTAAQAQFKQHLMDSPTPAGTNGFDGSLSLGQQLQWLQNYLRDAGPNASNAGTHAAQQKIDAINSQIQQQMDDAARTYTLSGERHQAAGNTLPGRFRT